MRVFTSRLGLVTRQLARAPYMAGGAFSAADISVGYALQMAKKNIGFALGPAEEGYVARLREREGDRRALDRCRATREWWAS